MKDLTTLELLEINGGSPRSVGRAIGCAIGCYAHAVADYGEAFGMNCNTSKDIKMKNNFIKELTVNEMLAINGGHDSVAYGCRKSN